MPPIERICPPYTGKDPYLYLAFSAQDLHRIRPLLVRLYEHGCRVWYSIRKESDLQGREHAEERKRNAALTVLVLSDAVRNDTAVKGSVLVNQAAGQPILCLLTDPRDSGLSMGLSIDAERIRIPHGLSVPEMEEAILHAPCFSQELLGPRPEPVCRTAGRIAWVLALLAVCMTAAALFYIRRMPNGKSAPEMEPAPEPTDSVLFADPAFAETIRDMLGGGPLTPERLGKITVLRLSRLPEKTSDLKLLSSLDSLELTQAAAEAVPDHPELFRDYTISVLAEDPE